MKPQSRLIDYLQHIAEDLEQLIFQYQAALEVKRQLRAKLSRLRRQLLIAQFLHIRFKRINFIYSRLHSLDVFFVGVTQHLPK